MSFSFVYANKPVLAFRRGEFTERRFVCSDFRFSTLPVVHLSDHLKSTNLQSEYLLFSWKFQPLCVYTKALREKSSRVSPKRHLISAGLQCIAALSDMTSATNFVTCTENAKMVRNRPINVGIGLCIRSSVSTANDLETLDFSM